MIELEILTGAHQGTVVRYEGESLTLGRSPDNTVVISDYHVSASHAQIFWEEGQFILIDLRSTNGTVLQRDGRRIPLNATKDSAMAIREGDRILLGDPFDPVVIEIRSITPPKDMEGTSILTSKSLQDIEELNRSVLQDATLAKILNELFQKISRSNLELNEVLKVVTEGVFELIEKASHVAIYLKDPYTERFNVAYSASRDGSDEGTTRSLTRLILEKKAALLVSDASQEIGSTESIVAARIQSLMGAPLWNGEEIIGILQCDNRQRKGSFSEDDLGRLSIISYQAALAIHNARLYRELRAYQERLKEENVYLKKGRVITFDRIIGNSRAMQDVFDKLRKVLDTRVSIHIQGETGTGKELVATAIHYESNRRGKMFVAQNCAALSETLLESELFGHVKGAFTGADRDKKGLFEIADGGTLFLDEIAEMSPALQAKLLRVLQEGEIRPVGSTEVKYVDVRIISATHKSLEEEVKAGRFREDLFYRLHVFPVRIPPLRERREDIPLLVEHFLEKFSRELGKTVKISGEAIRALQGYDWPGNVRELENEIHRLVILKDDDDTIGLHDLSVRDRGSMRGVPVDRIYDPTKTLKEMVEEVERIIILKTLEETAGNKTEAARRLGITREGLHKKLRKLGL